MKNMVGVVNSGIERVSGIVIHATHAFLWNSEHGTLLLAPHLFFIQPQAPKYFYIADTKDSSKNSFQEANSYWYRVQ